MQDLNRINSILEEKILTAPHFKWKEALWLPRWQIWAFPSSEIQKNIIKAAHKMEQIRDIIGKPIKVTSWFRPQVYNAEIKGALSSYHTKGLAVDFYVSGIKADHVREILEPHLARLGIRMERNKGSNWVHIDLGEVKSKRYFIP